MLHPPRRSRKGLWAVVILLVLAMPIGAYVVFGGGSVKTPSTPTVSSSPTATASLQADMSGNEAKRLESGLGSTNKTDYDALWVNREHPAPPTVRTAVMLDSGTFTSRGKYGRIDADIASAGGTTRWRLLLLRTGAHWNIYTMNEVK